MAPEWEPRELRGPLWEVTTALTLLLAGVDLFMMMHPAAVKTLKDVTKNLVNGGKVDAAKFADWVTVKA
jgi:acetyl-CoA decarbonylase/synthase complex subunit delta